MILQVFLSGKVVQKSASREMWSLQTLCADGDPPNFSPACDIGLKNNEDAAATESCYTATIPSYYFTILSPYHHTTSSYGENLLFQQDTFTDTNTLPWGCQPEKNRLPTRKIESQEKSLNKEEEIQNSPNNNTLW